MGPGAIAGGGFDSDAAMAARLQAEEDARARAAGHSPRPDMQQNHMGGATGGATNSEYYNQATVPQGQSQQYPGQQQQQQYGGQSGHAGKSGGGGLLGKIAGKLQGKMGGGLMVVLVEGTDPTVADTAVAAAIRNNTEEEEATHNRDMAVDTAINPASAATAAAAAAVVV